MRLLIRILSSLAILCLAAPLHAEYVITVEIVTHIETKAPEYRESIERLSSEPLRYEKVLGWVKVFSTEKRVEPGTYYLEWSYDNGSEVVVLDTHQTNDALSFDRRVNSRTMYYWVNKRIWTSNTGSYTLRVLERQDGELISVGEARLEVSKETSDDTDDE